ncbi:Cyclic nucleotide-binding domain-containing protein 2 [Exaiptasia diaphana]|nr:Cyclic nucleotide-binding domain-containing protein 2 [Exaiptasia diaphana]
MEASSLKQNEEHTFLVHKDRNKPSNNMEESSSDYDSQWSYSEVKIPQLMAKKFNFYNPTIASESKEKYNLKSRLPDFSLSHKTLVSNKKFLEKSILPDKTIARYMKARKIPYQSEDKKSTTRLPELATLKRSKSMVYPQRRAGSFAGFRTQSDNGNKIRKISHEQTTRQHRQRKLTPEQRHQQLVSRSWSEEVNQGSGLVESRENLMELDDQESYDDVFVQVHSTLSKRRPIERFQKIVRLLCFLLKIKSSTDRKYKQEQHGGVFEQLDELTETVVCNDDGMVFDPTYFKAVKDVKLSSDAVQILSMAPGTRTEEQLQAALAGLKASVAAFGEYPLKMQRRLVSVGWYESFEAKRVIIRQGHRAENFYFILSGTALVTLLVNDLATGEERTTTVAVLGKGCSFGELALLHHKTRSATVLCRNEVALLAVGREDFRDIFMSYEDGKETEHIQFLRNIPYIKDLPLDQCSTRPDICIFHYFRRGVVIVKNSKTEWIYIIKSGSCRVLTNLVKRRASLQTSKLKANTDIFSTPAIPVDEYERRKLLYTASAKEEVEAHREKIETLHRQLTSSSLGKSKTMMEFKTKNNNTEKSEQVCVQIELIKPKDQFGLASILYDNDAVNCHLVSNGAECILIKKSWFLQNADESLLRELRAQIPPYPTQERLQQRFQDQANWESFKTQTINDLLDTLQL